MQNTVLRIERTPSASLFGASAPWALLWYIWSLRCMLDSRCPGDSLPEFGDVYSTRRAQTFISQFNSYKLFSSTKRNYVLKRS